MGFEHQSHWILGPRSTESIPTKYHSCLPSDATCSAQAPFIIHLGFIFPSLSSHTVPYLAKGTVLSWHWLYHISCSKDPQDHPSSTSSSFVAWRSSLLYPCASLICPFPYTCCMLWPNWTPRSSDMPWSWHLCACLPFLHLKKPLQFLSMKNPAHFLRPSSNSTAYMKLSWIPHHSEMILYFSGLSAFCISKPLERPSSVWLCGFLSYLPCLSPWE